MTLTPKTLYPLALALLLAACGNEPPASNAQTETVTPSAEQNQQAEKRPGADKATN